MFRVAHAQAEGAKAAGAEPRDDRRALLSILEVVRALNRAEKTGENKMSAEDVDFVRKANDQITRYGFFGGIIGGTSTLFILRKANKMFRFTASVASWVITSAVGRFAAVDQSLEQMLNGLPADSQLRQASRKVVAMYAEEEGYFAKRYRLNVLEADAETELGLNTWHNDRDKFDAPSARPQPGRSSLATQPAESEIKESDESGGGEIFDMHAYFDDDDNANVSGDGGSSASSSSSSEEFSDSVSAWNAQTAPSPGRPSSTLPPPPPRPQQMQPSQYQQPPTTDDDPFSHGSPYPQFIGSGGTSSTTLPMYDEDYEDALIMEQERQRQQQQQDVRSWEDVRKDYYSHNR